MGAGGWLHELEADGPQVLVSGGLPGDSAGGGDFTRSSTAVLEQRVTFSPFCFSECSIMKMSYLL